MKKIVILLGIMSLMAFGESERGNNINFGVGAFYRNSVYKQKDNNEILPVPFVGVMYKDFYYEAPIELGYRFFKTENLTLSAYGRYNLYSGYKPKDLVDEYKDMDRRKDDFHIGLRERYKFSSTGLELASHVSGDVSGRSDGLLARMELNRLTQFSEKVFVQPYVAVEYMNSNYVDYYFGITKDEAGRNINDGKEYKADDSFNFEVGIRGFVDITKNFKLLASAGYTRYGNGVADSPLVRDRDIFVVGGGVSYVIPF